MLLSYCLAGWYLLQRLHSPFFGIVGIGIGWLIGVGWFVGTCWSVSSAWYFAVICYVHFLLVNSFTLGLSLYLTRSPSSNLSVYFNNWFGILYFNSWRRSWTIGSESSSLQWIAWSWQQLHSSVLVIGSWQLNTLMPTRKWLPRPLNTFSN